MAKWFLTPTSPNITLIATLSKKFVTSHSVSPTVISELPDRQNVHAKVGGLVDIYVGTAI